MSTRLRQPFVRPGGRASIRSSRPAVQGAPSGTERQPSSGGGSEPAVRGRIPLPRKAGPAGATRPRGGFAVWMTGAKFGRRNPDRIANGSRETGGRAWRTRPEPAEAPRGAVTFETGSRSDRAPCREVPTSISVLRTIRNVMPISKEMGLVRAPHTSAGRVPTVQGYRVFVDDLLAVKPLHSNEVRRLAGDLEVEVRAAPGPQEVVEAASRMLSEFTRFVGVVTVPRKSHEHLRHVEFLPLSGRRVLVVLVLNQAGGSEPHHRDRSDLYRERARAGRELSEYPLRGPRSR